MQTIFFSYIYTFGNTFEHIFSLFYTIINNKNNSSLQLLFCYQQKQYIIQSEMSKGTFRDSQSSTRQLLKIAFKKRPHSIEKLKSSLAINAKKYQNFVKCITMQTGIFNTSCIQIDAKKYIQSNQNKPQNLIKSMNKDKIQINNHRKGFSMHYPYFNTSTQQKNRISKVENRRLATQSAKSFQPQQNIHLKSDSFWRQKGAHSQKIRRRLKTQVERMGENTVGDLTQYCSRKNSKDVNFLIVQLQLNIEQSKRKQTNTIK